MSVFEDSAGKYFKGVRFFRSFPLERDPLRGSMWPLAGFHSGRPALAESRLGKGSVLLAAFPVNTKWSNLPLKPEFVPLVLRMVNHVQRRPDLDVPSAASADGLAEIGVSADWSPVRGKVTDSKGGSSSLTFRRSGERFVAPIEPSARKGFYDVQVSGGSGTHSRTGTVSIALNVAPEESDFRVVGERELKEMMPKARIRMVDATAEAQQAYGSVGDENEIWRPLIWILFAVIGVEFGIATTGSTRRKTAVTRGAGARLRAWLWETG
jgi:hypothetical protein